MSDSLLIKNALITSSKEEKEGDVLIENGHFSKIAPSINSGADRIIEAKGLRLIPGGLDPQVHFRDPGHEWKEDLESGSRAAAAGGITSFFDMPNNNPAITTKELMAEKKKRASEVSLVNYNFFIGATPNNVEELNTTPNVCGIKIFMGSSTGTLLVNEDKDLERIFSNGRRLIAVHAEDEATIVANTEKYLPSSDVATHLKIRSAEVALKATKRAVGFAKQFNRRLHILHTTTKDEALFLAKEKDPKIISAEVCPQHLLLSAPEIYQKLGTYAQMNPPLRTRDHSEGLYTALKDGTIDCIATDHAPHTREEKDAGYGKAPAGMPGVETSLPLMLNEANLGHCTLGQVIHWICEAPYRLYGVQNKGMIKEGYDGDCVLIDMNKEKTIENGKLFTKVNWSPYNGMTTKGWPIFTIVGGKIAFEEGVINENVRGQEIIIKAPWEN